MPSTIAKKIAKSTSGILKPAKSSPLRPARVVVMHPSKGTLTPVRFDAIVKKHEGRALTPGEERQFRRFAKDPYP